MNATKEDQIQMFENPGDLEEDEGSDEILNNSDTDSSSSGSSSSSSDSDDHSDNPQQI